MGTLGGAILRPPGAPDHGTARASGDARLDAAAPGSPLRALQRHRTAARPAFAAVRHAGAADLERRNAPSVANAWLPPHRGGAGTAGNTQRLRLLRVWLQRLAVASDGAWRARRDAEYRSHAAAGAGPLGGGGAAPVRGGRRP